MAINFWNFKKSPNIKDTIENVNEWDLIEFNRFCTAKETIMVRKRQVEWGKKNCLQMI